jgi:hypothetical protein
MGNKTCYGKGVNKNMLDARERDKKYLCKWWKNGGK